MSTRVVSQVIDLTAPSEAVSKYITRVGSDGIKIHPENWDGYSNYVWIDGTGFTYWDTNGNQVTKYGEDAIIGDEKGFHIEITANYENSGEPRLSFYRGPTSSNNEVAYISGSELYITQSVVLQQMNVGIPISQDGLGQWSWKVHEVNNRNNLYLKWLG